MGQTTVVTVAPRPGVVKESRIGTILLALMVLAIVFAFTGPFLRPLLESGVVACFGLLLAVYALRAFITMLADFVEKLD